MNYGRQKFILYVFTLIIFLLITRFIYIQFHMEKSLPCRLLHKKYPPSLLTFPGGIYLTGISFLLPTESKNMMW